VKAGWEKANTTPFSTIKLFYNSRRLNTEYKKNNLLGNFAGFIPLGLLLPFMLVWFRNGFTILLTGFFVSLGFESAQLLTGLGVFDIDDLILNTAGCFSGFILFIILRLILKRK
jgi:glycopeptide antibiotics resistance protein